MFAASLFSRLYIQPLVLERKNSEVYARSASVRPKRIVNMVHDMPPGRYVIVNSDDLEPRQDAALDIHVLRPNYNIFIPYKRTGSTFSEYAVGVESKHPLRIQVEDFGVKVFPRPGGELIEDYDDCDD